MLDVKIVRRAFSRASSSYDSSAFLQQQIGQELLEDIKSDNIRPERILDIGSGTGWFSQALANIFKVDILGIDSARGMVRLAGGKKGLKVLQAEAENLPFKDGSFDCLTSNLALQWVVDLDGAFREAARVLRASGNFYFTCFGPATLEELRITLKSNLSRDDYYPGFKLADEKRINRGLKNNGFENIDISTYRLSEHFNDLLSLLKWLKAVGANALNKPKFLSRGNLSKINEFYGNNFRSNGKVYATFHVIKVRAGK